MPMKCPHLLLRTVKTMVARYIHAWKKCSHRMLASKTAERAKTKVKTLAPARINHSGRPVLDCPARMHATTQETGVGLTRNQGIRAGERLRVVKALLQRSICAQKLQGESSPEAGTVSTNPTPRPRRRATSASTVAGESDEPATK